MRKFIILILTVLVLSRGVGYAEDDAQSVKPAGAPKSDKKIKQTDRLSGQKFVPIEIRRTGPEKSPRENFYYEGVQLKDIKQIKKVVEPLNDSDISGSLKSYDNKVSTGAVLIVGGCLAVGAGLIYAVAAQGTTITKTSYSFGYGANSYNVNASPDLTPTLVLAGTGLGFEIIGMILQGDAGNNRRDAVIRYNHLVAPDQDLSFFLMPDAKSPRLELTQRF